MPPAFKVSVVQRERAAAKLGSALTSQLPDHINLADFFMHAAGAFPVFGKERDRVWHDLDYFTGLVGVGAAAKQEVTELVAGDMAVPITRGAHPYASFAFTIGAFEDHHTASARFTFDHGGDHAPILEGAFIGGGVVELGSGRIHFQGHFNYLNM